MDVTAGTRMASLQPESILQGGEAAAGPAAGRDTRQEILLEQERRTIAERGPGDIAQLLTSGDTWRI